MLADFISQQRKKHGLTQEALAHKLSISRPTYIQIERGERELTVTEALSLAEIFGLSVIDFLGEKDIPISVEIKPTKVKKEESSIRISIPQESFEKFKQVLLYIIKKVGGKPNIGMTALYKLLYFIDFDYYERYEEQLLGLRYIKNHYGPTPIVFEKAVEQLLEANQIEVIKSKFYQREQKKYLINPTIEPDLSVLNGKEHEHIEWELKRLSDFNANALSDLSHRDVPWISAEAGMPIDYETVFYRTSETSVRDYNDSDKP